MALINHHFRTGARFSIFIASLVLVLLSSCKRNGAQDSLSQDYYDKEAEIANKRYGFSYYEGDAFKHLDSAYRHATSLSVIERFKFYSLYCGYHFHNTKDYAKAMTYTDSMVWVIEQSGNQDKMVKQYAEAYYSKGDIYFKVGNYDDAYKYYFKTKVIAKSLGDCLSSEYNYRLGMVLYRQKRFKSAAEHFRDAFEQAGSCNDTFAIFLRRQEVLNNTALSFGKAGMPDSALAYYDKALKYIDKNEPVHTTNAMTFRVARGVVFGNMGDIYVQKGEPDSAEILFKKSIWHNSVKHTELADGQLTRIKLARLYRQQNRMDAFHQTLDAVKGGMDSVNNADVKMNWHGLMSDYYISSNQPRKAYEHLVTYNRLKDSSQVSNQALISGDANAQLLSLEKEYEIDLLKENSQLQRLYLWVAILFTLMILVIVFLVLKNSQRSKRSIEELKKLNDQVNQQKETLEKTLVSLEHSSKEKDRILRAVAHDLRNPIGGIAAVSGLMLGSSENTDEQEEVFSLIRNASDDTLTLINELLEAAEGKHLGPTKKQWADVNALITNNVDLLQFKALEKKQRIVTELPDQPQQVVINREKMSRVISNLISNAIKFSPEGTDILTRAYHSGGKLIIAVTDQGIGIPDKLKDKIFDMFTTAKRPGTSGEKPFGLGLYISNEIVKAHNGRMWFENNAGAGVTFFIELDIEDSQSPA